jgi:prepilin-type N-terminal cleavage/methylation domain-containing protein
VLIGRLASRRRQQRLDEGFTLIELIVTMMVISVVLLGLLAVQTSALSTVTLSRERQQATDLANRTMEQLRALPYDSIAGGLLNTDAAPASDPSIKLVAGALRYQPPHKTSIDELLVTRSAANCPQTNVLVPDDCPPLPLYPHVQTDAAVKIGKVQFRVASYVTLVSTVPTDTSLGYWLSVDVTWSSPHSRGRTTRVGTRSQVFSPSGCLSTATHPFSGPCQAYFESFAGSTPAGISVSADTPGGVALLGNPLQKTAMTLPSLSAVVQSEQIVSAQSTSAAPQTLLTTGGVESTTGGTAATTGATTDPATGEPTVPAADERTQAGDSVTLTGPDSSFVLARGGSQVRASSTTKATSTTACRTVTDADITSTQACSSGRTTLTGAVAASLTYGTLIPLASIDAPGSPSRAVAARFTAAGGPYCTSTTGVGCIVADALRSAGAAFVGGVPAGATRLDGVALPPSFAMVTSDPHTATAKTESSYELDAVDAPRQRVAPTAPAATRTGRLVLHGGEELLLHETAAKSRSLVPLAFRYPGPGGTLVDVVLTGTVTVGETAAVSYAGSPSLPVPAATKDLCKPDVCAATASSGAVVASVTYDLSTGGSPIGKFTVTVDLGASTARTSYRATP